MLQNDCIVVILSKTLYEFSISLRIDFPAEKQYKENDELYVHYIWTNSLLFRRSEVFDHGISVLVL